jgi:molybdopterin/thiamine biosynthesis adenylyltransferase
MINPKRVKLPDGRVLPYRPDPMEAYLGKATIETPVAPQVSVPALNTQRQPARSTATYQDADILDARQLEGTEIVVVGAGAVGSYLTYFLAGAAALVIHLIDFDVIERRHTQGGRTIYEAGQVHQKKVFAARDIVERQFPNSTVRPYPYNVLDMPDAQLRLLAKRAAIVVNAIDDAAGILRVNDLFYWLTEVVYVALHPQAASGHVILTVPPSACLRCSLDIASPGNIQTLHAEPGLGVDIRLVANHATTIALEIILSKATGRPIERWDISKNIFYFANKREQGLSPDGPGVHLQRAEKRPGCPICSVAPRNDFLRR